MSQIRNSKIIVAAITLLGLLILSQSALAGIRRDRYNTRPDRQTFRPEWSFQVLLDNRPEEGVNEGITLALQSRQSQFNAWRLSLSGFQSDLDYDDDHALRNDNLMLSLDYGRRLRFDGGAIKLQHLVYPSPNREVNLYFGLGPRLTAFDIDPERVVIYLDQFPYSWVDHFDYDDATRLGLGVEAVVGMEWFMGRNISLLGELGWGIEHRWYFFDMRYYDVDGYHQHETETFSDGVHVDTPRLSLGMALHF